MKNELPRGTAGFEDGDGLLTAWFATIGILVAVSGALIGVGVVIGYLIRG